MTDMKLFEKAVAIVVGRPVTVRLRHPIIRNFDGQAITWYGKYYIDISPDLDEKQTLYVFLHEAAHVKLGHAVELDPAQLPGYFQLDRLGQWARQYQPTTLDQENAADREAHLWQVYADDHAAEHPGGWLESRLRVLAGYIPADLKARAIKTAARGAAETIRQFKEQSR